MYIESIELLNFRNYSELSLQLDQGTNIIYGNNAQGKTNILEAIYVCGTTKSHRGSKDRELLRFGEEEAHIRMFVRRQQVPYKIDMHLKKNKSKGIAINGIPIRKASELFGIVNIIFFSPEDLNIIKNGPAERRRFLDLELCQLHQYYLAELIQYNKVVTQRNKLLKEIGFSPELMCTLDVWDEQMISYGTRIIRERASFVEQLGRIIKEIHSGLTGGREEIELLYDPNIAAEEFAEQLARDREKDLKFRLSGVGPHRDDLCILVNGVDIRRFGSQGQQRTAALSMKLSEIYLVKQMIRDTPVLLLDDVLSELDSSRQNYLLQSIHDIQTLITCTGLDDFVNNQFSMNRVFEVVNGTVSKNN